MLDPDFLRRLERLAIVARKSLKGVGQGERRSKRHGGSVEFSDYRRYSPGDDTRRIDWYAYARLEQMFLKLYVEEQDLCVHVLLDQSKSMETGHPPKLAFARQLAVALAYVALSAGDRVSLRVVRGGQAGRPFGPLRGRHGLSRLLRHMGEDPGAAGQTSLGASIKSFLARSPSPGVVLLISDLLDPAGVAAPLEQLRYSGYEPHVLHVIAPDEAEPEVGEDVELEDVETGELATVSLDQPAVRAYRAAFAAFQEEITSHCRRHGIGYAVARTDVPVDELVLGALRQSELLR